MRTAVLLILIFTMHGIGICADSKIDNELEAVKKQRDQAVARALEPINRRYEAVLEDLLRKATQMKDFEGVLKISNELKAIQKDGDKGIALENTEWTWERPGVVEWIKFYSDGTFLHPNFSGKWELIRPRVVKLTFSREALLEFASDGNSYEAKSDKDKREGVFGTKKVN